MSQESATPLVLKRPELAPVLALVSDALEGLRAIAQTEAHPTDIDKRTRDLLRDLSAVTAVRTAVLKAATS